MRDVAAIIDLLARRQKDLAPAHASMRMFEQYIAGDLAVAVPELDSNEKSAIANLAAQGLEQMALRAGSTRPDVKCPPDRQRQEGTYEKHEKTAQTKRLALLGFLDANDIGEVNTLRFSHLFAHGLMPVTVLPDPDTQIPRWTIKSPLDTFPAPSHDPLEIVPRDCIFTRRETYGWLKSRYPAQAANLYRPSDMSDDDQIQVIEYMDRDEIVWVARHDGGQSSTYQMVGSDTGVLLERLVNKAMTPLAFVPGWVTVVGVRGKFTNTIGAHQMRAKLLSLAYLTAYKGAMPEMWVEPLDNSSTPSLVQVPDPRTGEPGLIEGGRLQQVQVNPGFMTSPMLSILEREIRVEGGIPSELGGEASSNVRTGRRGDQLLGASIDYPIQRAQRLMEKSMTAELKAAIAIVKHWTPAKKSFYVNWRNANGWVDYDPKEAFASDEVRVAYSMAGSDLNTETIRAGQKIGTGMWSKKTAREQDPETQDADLEEDRIAAERMEELAFGLLQQQIAQAQIGVEELADMSDAIVADKKSFLQAMKAAHEAMQKRQAEAAAQAQQQQAPAAGDPNAQPGMGPQGGILPGPTSDMDAFRSTLQSLHPAQAQLPAGVG